MNKVSLYGGLGNQMFQYAFCLALNAKGKKARITFSNYFYYKHHQGFDLDRAFKLHHPPAQTLLASILQHSGFLLKYSIVRKINRRLALLYQSNQVAFNEKQEYTCDTEVFNQLNTVFIGTWQCIDYFKPFEKQVREHFKFSIPTDAENSTIIKKIMSTNAVSVHVRRGDYLNENWQHKLHVIRTTKYYNNATAYIEKEVPAPHYFIFSDDVEWAKQNLAFKNCTYITHNHGNSSFIDMYLMSLCKHNIIANSTFSWWGAWLNNNENKIVIMPNKWMNEGTCEGIFPAEWIKVDV
jgi:hypothetical protein